MHAKFMDALQTQQLHLRSVTYAGLDLESCLLPVYSKNSEGSVLCCYQHIWFRMSNISQPLGPVRASCSPTWKALSLGAEWNQRLLPLRLGFASNQR